MIICASYIQFTKYRVCLNYDSGPHELEEAFGLLSSFHSKEVEMAFFEAVFDGLVTYLGRATAALWNRFEYLQLIPAHDLDLAPLHHLFVHN